MARSTTRIPYVAAARSLLRTSVLDAMRDLLTERDWSKITLSDVAKRAGVSRQTLYNEFGSRTGLAEAYAFRLAEDLVAHVDKAVWENVGDARAALEDGLRNFLLDKAADPLIQSFVSGEVKVDLLRLITVDSGPLLTRASDLLTEAFLNSWIDVTRSEAQLLARNLVRFAASFIALPQESDYDVAADLAELMSPYIERVINRA